MRRGSEEQQEVAQREVIGMNVVKEHDTHEKNNEILASNNGYTHTHFLF